MYAFAGYRERWAVERQMREGEEGDSDGGGVDANKRRGWDFSREGGRERERKSDRRKGTINTHNNEHKEAVIRTAVSLCGSGIITRWNLCLFRYLISDNVHFLKVINSIILFFKKYYL